MRRAALAALARRTPAGHSDQLDAAAAFEAASLAVQRGGADAGRGRNIDVDWLEALVGRNGRGMLA